jgi:cysteine desulfurase family protein
VIYFNNAATTYPKPKQVTEAVARCIEEVPEAQFRNSASGHGSILNKCRENLARLFHIEEPDRIFFTSGATEALNLIIRGLSFKGKHVVTTVTEHNSVLRPLAAFIPGWIGKDNEQVSVVNCDLKGEIAVEEIEKSIRKNTSALFINHCSNVTGAVQDIQRIGEMTRSRGILLIVDASQSAGFINIDVEKTGIDILVFTGHKGLFGIQGTGGFYLRPGLDLEPLKYGGTGKDSHIISLPSGPFEYEVGTMNVPGISALNSGVEYVLKHFDTIVAKEGRLTAKLRSCLNKIEHVSVYCSLENICAPIVSFRIAGLSPSDLGYVLNAYGFVTRTGLHCAPLMHKALSTYPEGLVRVSLSCFNTEEEIDSLVRVITEISESM